VHTVCIRLARLPLVPAVAFHNCSQYFATPFVLDAASSDANSSGDNDLLCYLCSTDVTCTCKTVYTQAPLLVSCDLQRVLINNNSTSPGGILQACQTMDKHNRCQHECCTCKSLKRSCKDTGVSRDAKITSACSISILYRCIFVYIQWTYNDVTSMGSKGQVPYYNTYY